MELTPKSLRKKPRRKRYRTSFLAKHWRNPFQVFILSVAVLSYIVSFGVGRVRQHKDFERLTDRAQEIRGELDALQTQAFAVRSNLLEQTAGDFDEKLQELNQQLSARFAEFNDCFTALPHRYRLKYEIQQSFAEDTRRYLESALALTDYERARLGFNSSPVSDLLESIRPAVAGLGRLEILAGDDVYNVIVWSLKSDGPRLVVCDHVGRSNEFPFVIPSIAKGSYLVFVTRADGGLAPYPVYIGHGENKQWEIEVPQQRPEGMVFVPGGDFICGDEHAKTYRTHTRFLPSFFIQKHEVTFAEYIEFWQSLSDPERQAQMMSRVQFAAGDEMDAWDATGQLTDERLKLTYPVVGISWEAATAFCEWKRRETGRPIRLPTAFEWEKAARGVDGRTYVWGYEFDPDQNLTLTQANPKGKSKYPLWAPPGKFSADTSVYNAYDMAGNVREMTSTQLPGSETRHQIKGGSAFTPATFLPCASSSDSPVVPSDIGFRYIQEIAAKKQ